jgi:hypothetical protein
MLMYTPDSRRRPYWSAGCRLWLDGREPPYWLHRVVAILLGYARQLFPCRVASLRGLHVVRVRDFLPTELLIQTDLVLECKRTGVDKQLAFYGVQSSQVL